MRDCSTEVRNAYTNRLNNWIFYEGRNVPVYGNDSFKTPPKNYAIIGDIVETPLNTNHSFTSNVTVTIDIFSEQYMTCNNSVVDTIASDILDALIPNTEIEDIGNVRFQIFPMSRISSRYLTSVNGQNYLVRKIIVINNLVNQLY